MTSREPANLFGKRGSIVQVKGAFLRYDVVMGGVEEEKRSARNHSDGRKWFKGGEIQQGFADGDSFFRKIVADFNDGIEHAFPDQGFEVAPTNDKNGLLEAPVCTTDGCSQDGAKTDSEKIDSVCIDFITVFEELESVERIVERSLKCQKVVVEIAGKNVLPFSLSFTVVFHVDREGCETISGQFLGQREDIFFTTTVIMEEEKSRVGRREFLGFQKQGGKMGRKFQAENGVVVVFFI